MHDCHADNIAAAQLCWANATAQPERARSATADGADSQLEEQRDGQSTAEVPPAANPPLQALVARGWSMTAARAVCGGLPEQQQPAGHPEPQEVPGGPDREEAPIG